MATEDVTSSFRVKANYMKTWKPASTPSNRDRLELYALHKQAVSGDAPKTMPSSITSNPEKAKYNAWRSKNGLVQAEAMRLYLQESERQIRVYGVTQDKDSKKALVNETNGGVHTAAQVSNYTNDGAVTGSGASTASANGSNAPRGLAAIPLLCAAASESRVAYIRRLSNTSIENSWWNRQEPLCAPPGSVWSIPEGIIIGIASLVERLSLSCKDASIPLITPSTIQSFLWPLHNCLLSLWMGTILLSTAYTAGIEFIQTVMWGGRRTGNTLPSIFHDKVQLSSDSIYTMTEVHQPISARLVGLALLPYTTLVNLLLGIQQIICGGFGIGGSTDLLVVSTIYVIVMGFMTWFYWLVVCPWLGTCLMGVALLSGNCFALIDLAGV